MFNNNFCRFFVLFIVAIIPTFSFQTNASSIDWDDITVESAKYDMDDEELNITFQIEDVSSEPDEDYWIIIEFDGDEEMKQIKYDDDDEILYAKYSLDVDSSDIEDEYDLNYTILDDYDREEADDSIEFTVSGLIDWDDIEVQSAEYNEDNEELTIIFQVEDISSEPDLDYEMTIEFDGDDYTEDFEYDEDDEILSVEITIDIDEDDIEDDYEIYYEIVDEDDDKEADESIDIDVEIVETTIDWDDITVESIEYDDDDEELTFTFQIEDVTSEPDLDYEITIEIDGDDYNEDFEYDDEILYAEFTIDIDEDDIDDEYDIEYIIIDEDDNEVADDNIDIDVESSSTTIDWDDITIKSSEYDEDDEELTLIFQIKNISEEPDLDYEMTIEFDKDDYTEDFEYDEDDEILYVEFTIDVDEDDIEDEYDIDYIVTDEDDDEVADDSIDFELGESDDGDDWKIVIDTAEYNETDEELTLVCLVEDISSDPDGYQRLIIDLDGDQYTKLLNYHDDDEELYAKFTIDIDSSDIEDDYEMEYLIIDGENEAAEDSVEFDVEESDAIIDRNDLSLQSATYDEDDEELTLKFQIDNISEEPGSDYEMTIEFDNDDYTEDLDYNEDNEILYAEFTIDVDEDDIEEQYEIEYIITDDDDDEKADGNIDIEVGENIVWTGLKIKTGKYDLNTGILNFSIYLGDIDVKPSGEYSTLIEINGDDYESTFEYDETNEILIANFSINDIDEDDLKNTYPIEFEIKDKNGSTELTANGDLKVSTTYVINYVTVGNDEDDEREVEISDNIVSIVNKVVTRIAKSQKSDDKIISNLELLVEKLQEIADNNSKYDDIVSDLNYLFEKAIEKYENM